MGELILRVVRRIAGCAGLLVLVASAGCDKHIDAKPVVIVKPSMTVKSPEIVESAPVDWCKRLSDRLPTVSAANCAGSALQPSGATSLRGVPILMRQIPAMKNGRANNKAVRVLLLGGIHGDELTASAIVFHWMQWMKTSPAQDFYWDIVPVVNPDGLLAAKPMRVNANGVDLNRNFPTPNWRTDAPVYWAKRTGKDPRRFPGVTPLSEPETRWVNQEMERFQPQVIISVHAPFGVLDFDGPAKPPHKFGRLILNPVGVYPGSLGNYSGMHKNVPVITIELPNAQAMPSEAEVKRIWLDMLAWIQRNVPEKEISPNKSSVIAAK
ncbi:MAG TPA: M14 family murein peptide amidase A [Burkholderiaceae bacterium]